MSKTTDNVLLVPGESGWEIWTGQTTDAAFTLHAATSIERAALTIGDRVTDGSFTGPILLQDGDESVFKDEDVGLVIRKTADLVLAQ